MDRIELVHPDLPGQPIRVHPDAEGIHRGSGWVRPDELDTAETPEPAEPEAEPDADATPVEAEEEPAADEAAEPTTTRRRRSTEGE